MCIFFCFQNILSVLFLFFFFSQSNMPFILFVISIQEETTFPFQIHKTMSSSEKIVCTGVVPFGVRILDSKNATKGENSNCTLTTVLIFDI